MVKLHCLAFGVRGRGYHCSIYVHEPSNAPKKEKEAMTLK
jgi:hypothetical protein